MALARREHVDFVVITQPRTRSWPSIQFRVFNAAASLKRSESSPLLRCRQDASGLFPCSPVQLQRFAGIRFEEIARQAGLNFVTRNCATPNKNQIETMVAGVALFDYDSDGFLDIYWSTAPRFPRSKKPRLPTGTGSSATTTTAHSPMSLRKLASPAQATAWV